MDHPAIQAGVAPFVVALSWAAVSVWRSPRLLGAGVVLAFLLTAWWVGGLGLQPMTSTRKLVWAVLAAGSMGVLCDLFQPPRRLLHNLWWLLAGGVALWMVWPAARYLGGWSGVAVSGGAFLFATVVTALADAIRSQQNERTPALAWILPLAAGSSCLFGASAYLGQLGLGLGSGALAVWLVARWRGVDGGVGLLLPPVMGAALVAVAGTVYAKVSVISLVGLALAVLVQWLPFPRNLAQERSVRYRTALVVFFSALAVAWTAFIQGAPPV